MTETPQGCTDSASSTFLARDPLGIKALYHTRSEGAFLFATEVRGPAGQPLRPSAALRRSSSSMLLFGFVRGQWPLCSVCSRVRRATT